MSNTRVLVVEDESIVAKSIQSRLKSLGYTVPAVVSSGEEAVHKAEETRPDLVLMDIVLKGRMDGIKAAREIYNRLNIPIVYLTAYSDDNTIERAKLTEPFGYVLKPFGIREIRSAIEIALHKHRVENNLRQKESWLSTTLEKVSDGVLVMDDKGLIRYLNPRAESLLGRRREDAVGKSFAPIFKGAYEKTNKRLKNLIENILAGDERFGTQNCIVLETREESKISIDLDIVPLRGETGKNTGVAFLFHGIKEREYSREKSERPRLATFGYKKQGDTLTLISLLVATTSDLVREGIREMLEPEQNMRILAEASNQGEIIPMLIQKKPDVLIVDTAIPGLDIHGILGSITENSIGTRVLLLLRTLDERFILDSISMGVKGCLSNSSDRTQFLQAITEVNRNRIWVEVEVMTKILSRLIQTKKGKSKLISPYLTKREEDLARLVAMGYSNKRISKVLLISEKTVKSHLRNIFKKLGVDSRFQLALKYPESTSKRT
jgi:PAS domain S-box-containing protein